MRPGCTRLHVLAISIRTKGFECFSVNQNFGGYKAYRECKLGVVLNLYIEELDRPGRSPTADEGVLVQGPCGKLYRQAFCFGGVK